MLGLIKKDFLLMKSNLKSMIVIFVFYFMALQGAFDIVLVIPLIGLILFVSTFSYDDFNNWNPYAITLPDGRKNVVRAKYLATIIITIILAIVSLIISIGISYIKSININFEEIISSLIGNLFPINMVISLLYPIMFKFGSTKGRIILFTVVFGITVIGTIIMNFIDVTGIINMLNNLGNWSLIILSIVLIILLGISYLISNKIYQNKEF